MKNILKINSGIPIFVHQFTKRKKKMTYFLKRFKPTEKYSIAKFASVSLQSEGDTHKIGEDYAEALERQKDANEQIKAGNQNPLGEWRSGIEDLGQTINLDE